MVLATGMQQQEAMKKWRTELTNRMSAVDLPIHCRSSIYRYLMFGQPLGSFLSAVMSNELTESFSNADNVNEFAMKRYAQFLYSSCPTTMWGSRAIVEDVINGKLCFFPVCRKCHKLKGDFDNNDCTKHTVTPLWEWV